MPVPSHTPCSAATRQALASAGLDPDAVVDLVRRAVAEDLAPGPSGAGDPTGPGGPAGAEGPTCADGPAGAVDATSVATVPPALRGRAAAVARAPGVVAGLAVAAAVFETVLSDQYGASPDGTGAPLATQGLRPPRARSDDLRAPFGPVAAWVNGGSTGELDIRIVAADGDRVSPGDTVLTVTGPVRALLTAERTALNLLCHLSGVATATRAWVDAVAGTGARIRDTRKTLPGLRALEKYAVRCGGGVNHRMSLADAALVKDNHVVAAGGVAAAFTAVRTSFPGLPVEVECDTVAQVGEAVAAGADLILCDNMGPDELRQSVVIAHPAGVKIEASGGLTIEIARAVAQTGVDYLAVGALTHSARALDLGLDLAVDADLPMARTSGAGSGSHGGTT